MPGCENVSKEPTGNEYGEKFSQGQKHCYSQTRVSSRKLKYRAGTDIL